MGYFPGGLPITMGEAGETYIKMLSRFPYKLFPETYGIRTLKEEVIGVFRGQLIFLTTGMDIKSHFGKV